jgi:hypothetical protein
MKPNIILVKADHTIGLNRIELTLPIRKSALFSFIFGFAGVFLGGFFSIAGIISAKQALRYIGYPDNDPRSVWFAKAGLKMSYLGIIELLIVIGFVFAHKISNVICVGYAGKEEAEQRYANGLPAGELRVL